MSLIYLNFSCVLLNYLQARRGRENAVAIQQMLEHIIDHNKKTDTNNKIITSVELEKAVPEFCE